jgi:hypothetical protein
MLARTMIAAAFSVLFLSPAPASAEDSEGPVGSWELASFYTEDARTKIRYNVYGPRPKGYMVVTHDGHFHAYVATDWPNPEPSIWGDVAQYLAQQTGAHRAVRYSGRYRVKGSQFIVRVDQAWHDGRVGADPFDISWTEGRTMTEETRTFFIMPGSELSPEALHIETAPMPNPNGFGNTTIGTVVWVRTSK